MIIKPYTKKEKKIIEEFKNFLREKGAYDIFKENFMRQNMNIFKKVESVRVNKRAIINWSFSWSMTPQKHSFWSNLNSEWARKYDKLKTIKDNENLLEYFVKLKI